MSRAAIYFKRGMITMYLVTVHGLLGYLAVERFWPKYDVPIEADVMIPVPAASPTADLVPAPQPSQTVYAAAAPPMQPLPGKLIVPVAGITPNELMDSFSDARGEGRVHDAIDIAAPAGTPVLAAADGEIVKFLDSMAGGITIYQSSVDKRFIYYYGHLMARAAELKEGDQVKQGQTIGYVGDTGNAGPGNYHLHFSVAAVADPKRYWDGVYINPLTLLRER